MVLVIEAWMQGMIYVSAPHNNIVLAVQGGAILTFCEGYASYEFDGSECRGEYLRLDKNDVVMFLAAPSTDAPDDRWAYGKLEKNDTTGYYPPDYVKVYERDRCRPGDASMQIHERVETSMQLRRAGPVDPISTVPPQPNCRFVDLNQASRRAAIASFDASVEYYGHHHMLSLSKGDLIYVCETLEGETDGRRQWTYGYKVQEGWFPNDCVVATT